MALPPQTTTSDAFLREVEEEVRRDKAIAFGRRWGATLVAAVVIGLALLAFGLWWQEHRAAQAESAAETETALLDALGHGQKGQAATAVPQLLKAPGRGYPMAGTLLRGDVALIDDNVKAAAADFRRIADDTSLPQPARDAATIRLAGAEFDQVPPQTTITRLHALAAPGSPWFGTAGELTAMAELRMGRSAEAGSLLAAIGRDSTVPATIRARTLQLASSLGVDAGDVAGGIR